MDRVTTARARPTSTPSRCGTRSTRSTSWSSRDVNNGVYRCGFAGSQEAYDKAYDRLFDRLDWLSRPAGRPALPGRRHHHRGRRPAVHHAGPLRRRLPRPLQVQPAEADRAAGAVGLRAGPVPDPRLRRHHRLRPDQAALLRGAHRHQSDRDRARGARLCRLVEPARPRAARRPAVRRRHPAGPRRGRTRSCRQRSGCRSAEPGLRAGASSSDRRRRAGPGRRRGAAGGLGPRPVSAPTAGGDPPPVGPTPSRSTTPASTGRPSSSRTPASTRPVAGCPRRPTNAQRMVVRYVHDGGTVQQC